MQAHHRPSSQHSASTCFPNSPRYNSLSRSFCLKRPLRNKKCRRQAKGFFRSIWRTSSIDSHPSSSSRSSRTQATWPSITRTRETTPLPAEQRLILVAQLNTKAAAFSSRGNLRSPRVTNWGSVGRFSSSYSRRIPSRRVQVWLDSNKRTLRTDCQQVVKCSFSLFPRQNLACWSSRVRPTNKTSSKEFQSQLLRGAGWSWSEAALKSIKIIETWSSLSRSWNSLKRMWRTCRQFSGTRIH